MTKADYGKKSSFSSKRLESTTAIMGTRQQAHRHGAEAVAENVHHDPPAQDREKWREAERVNRELIESVLGFRNLKAHPSNKLQLPNKLTLPNPFQATTNWESSIQMATFMESFSFLTTIL